MSLDPKENRQERERKKAAENKIPPLNPPFPFRALPFSPFTFDLHADPPQSDTFESTLPSSQ